MSCAEKALLGLCMRSRANLEAAINLGLSPAMFDHPSHGEIFAAMLLADRSGSDHDLVALGCALPQHVSLLAGIETDAPVTQNVEYYAEEVMAAYWCRGSISRLRDVAKSIKARKPFESLTPIRTLAAHALDVMSSEIGKDDSEPRILTDVLSELEPKIERRVIDFRSGQMAGISSGLTQLDKATGGWKDGRMYVLAARTSLGKTTLALNFASTAAEMGHQVLFFTVEMPRSQIVEKIISKASNVPGSKIENGSLSDKDLDSIHLAQEKIHRSKIWIDDRFQGSLERIMSTVRRFKRRGHVDLVIVDYIQLLHTQKRSEKKQAEVTAISNALKAIAIELNLPIIVLCQINREAEKPGDKNNDGPGLHHLKDSGAIEQDADAVLIIHREAADTDKRRTWIKIEKNRGGISKVKFLVNAQLAINTFSNAAINESVWEEL